MVNYRLILFSLLCLLCVGCPEQKIKEPNDKIQNLESEIKKIKDELFDLESKLSYHQFSQHPYDEISLDTSSPKGYQRIDSNTGIFLISLKDIKPYVNGYKLLIHIGNPSTVLYNGFKLNITYGKKYDYKKKEPTYKEWNESLKEKEISFTDVLRPGCWNKVEFIISPASSDELGYFKVSMVTNLLSLIEKKK